MVAPLLYIHTNITIHIYNILIIALHNKHIFHFMPLLSHDRLTISVRLIPILCFPDSIRY